MNFYKNNNTRFEDDDKPEAIAGKPDGENDEQLAVR